MEAKPYSKQSSGDTSQFRLVETYKPVINAGIGSELYLSKQVSLFASFSTDFSAVADDITGFFENKTETRNSIFKSDFYHFGGGVVLNLRGADLTLGITHTGAKIDLPRPFKFPQDNDDTIFDTEDKVEADWDRWRIVFSFSFPFLKDLEDKAMDKLGL